MLDAKERWQLFQGMTTSCHWICPEYYIIFRTNIGTIQIDYQGVNAIVHNYINDPNFLYLLSFCFTDFID